MDVVCAIPAYFNEDILQDVSEDMRPFGLVLSHHTSEPPFANGYLRPSNSQLESYEVPRGISAKLELAGEDGLLKREANVGTNIEKSNFTFMQEPIAKSKPRIGIDGMSVVENDGEIAPRYAIASTEATSVHTDRQVGQRFILAGGVSTSNRAVDNLNLHTLNLTSAKQVMKFGTTHGIPPLGGTYILEVSSDGESISDHVWGASTGVTTNPYQTSDHDSKSYKTNIKDTTIKFLVRPVRVLDNKHVELFRDDTAHVLSATAAGRYGLFVYDHTKCTRRIIFFHIHAQHKPCSKQSTLRTCLPFPNIRGGSINDAPKVLDQRYPVAKQVILPRCQRNLLRAMIVSNNTLQHFRGDAARRQSVRTDDEEFIRHDFNVQPRYTHIAIRG